MGRIIEQGRIIKVEGIKDPVLVVSDDVYNKCGHVLVCPIIANKNLENAINIPVHTKDIDGLVLCDQIRNLNISNRPFQVRSMISIDERMLISDVIQGLLEYI